jgi:hypothetical protein
VILTATAAAGSTFAGWSGGGCTGTGTCTVTPVAATTIMATFNPVMFTLTVSVQGGGTGAVTSAPTGISCGATCAASFASGTPVTLTPAPTTGSVFAGWSGACTGSAGCTVTLDQARAVTASFSRVFTDATLTARVTVVRAVHVSELRAAIDTLRARQGLTAFAWTDSSLAASVTPIKRSHLVEMRTALTAVFTARGLPAPTWTDPAITSGTTVIKAAHITELRTATLALQ